MSSAPLPSSGTTTGWRRIFTAERVALFLLILAAALPYLSSLTFGFVYDDLGVIVEVPSRHTWLGVAQAWVQSYWGNPETGLYRPVAQFMYALLWNLGSGKPWIFHLYAIVIHVATTLGLWWLLARATNRWAAFFGALLFAVDPVHVEAVANIVNSSEVLVALFGIACIGVVLRASMRSDGGVEIGWKPALLAAGAYMLAIGAKESGAGIPAIAFLCLWGWRAADSGQRPTFREVLVGGWRVWALCTVALVGVVTARFFVLGGLTVSQHWVTHEVRNFGFAPRFWTMTAAWPLVARLLVWPSRLRMHYGSDIVIPLTEPTIWAVLSLAMAALIVIAASVVAWRGDRRPLVAIAWVVIAFLPASNLLVPTGQLLAERTLYLPSVGVALLAAWAINAVYEWARALGGTFVAQLATGVPLAAVAIGALFVTYPEVLPWQTNYTLFLHGIEQAPLASRPWQLMGDLYANQGDHHKAIKYLERAHNLEPGNDNIVYFYSEQLHAIGAYEGELALLRDAAKENPDVGADVGDVSRRAGHAARAGLGAGGARARARARLDEPQLARGDEGRGVLQQGSPRLIDRDVSRGARAAAAQRQPALSAREHAAADGGTSTKRARSSRSRTRSRAGAPRRSCACARRSRSRAATPRARGRRSARRSGSRRWTARS